MECMSYIETSSVDQSTYQTISKNGLNSEVTTQISTTLSSIWTSACIHSSHEFSSIKYNEFKKIKISSVTTTYCNGLRKLP